MNQKELDELMEKMIVEEKAIMNRKGPDYTDDNLDRLANFKETAKKYGMAPLQALGVHFEKHYSTFIKFSKGRELTGEGIKSKISDMRNYLLLARALIEESKQEQSEDHKPLSPYNNSL